MYVGHMLVVRRSLANRLGGFRREFDGVQDFEFMLRLGEATPAVAHLPEVLYHWRAIDGSLAAASDAKHGIDGLQAGAVQAHLDRLGIPATATAHPRFRHRCVVSPKLARFPRVSIVIPTKDQPGHIGGCLASIFAKTRYPDFEVVVVDNGTTDERAAAMLRAHPVRVVPFTSSFNFSAASNAGAAAATGEVLVFLNNDTTVISSDWLEHLVFHLVAADVGAVGPLLLYPDGSVQHAGVVLGARGTADHVMRRFPADADGYAGSLSCPREVSAVTGACLAIRRDAFVRVGGWNELYATHYQDVDLCLRLRRAGLRIIFTPDARLTHHESPSRGDRYDLLDRLLLIDTWKDELAAGDSAYPAACSLERLDYSPRDPALEVCRA
jgi:GT2 family glycosyltransferase